MRNYTKGYAGELVSALLDGMLGVAGFLPFVILAGLVLLFIGWLA